MISRRIYFIFSAMLTMGLVLMVIEGHAEVVGCEQLTNVSTRNKYIFDNSTCDVAQKQTVASIISILDNQIIAPISNWLDPEKSIPQITVSLRSNESPLDGEFLTETPTTIYLRDDIFIGPERVLVVAHELQHLYNFHFKGLAYKPADWLDEGLSMFVQFEFTNNLPRIAIDKIRIDGRTAPLLDFSNEAADVEGRSYANAGLFITYLARHFGGMDFIRDLIRSPFTDFQGIQASALKMRNQGRHQIEDDYISLNSLFLNYSISLAVNTPRFSQHELFSLGGDGFFSLFSSIHIEGRLLVLPIRYDKLGQTDSLSPYQSEYYIVPADYQCLKVSPHPNMDIYKVWYDGNNLKIRSVADAVAGESNPYELIIVNYDQPSQIVIQSCN